MPRRDTNDNRYNRQVPNNTQIIHVFVDTIMGTQVTSFLVDDKADIIAAKAKKTAGSWVADWPACKYTKTGYTKSGNSRAEVVEDVTAKIRRMMITWHLREHFELQRAQKGIGEIMAQR
jgi:hypothetical protein